MAASLRYQRIVGLVEQVRGAVAVGKGRMLVLRRWLVNRTMSFGQQLVLAGELINDAETMGLVRADQLACQ